MLVIDRFEGDKAVIENGDDRFELDRNKLPKDAAEGDVIVLSDGVYLVDSDLTEKRRRKILELQNSLWE